MNLVERLRKNGFCAGGECCSGFGAQYCNCAIRREAADRIEELEKQLSNSSHQNEDRYRAWEDRLREAR